jgi:3-methyladenine DNA glycosylase AlkC
MNEPLKNMYNVQFFERLSPILKKVIPDFNELAFIYSVFDTSWPDLELKQRTRRITTALHKCLPEEYPKAADMIVGISRFLRENKEYEQSYPFIFLPDYIALYGLEHYSISMKAIEEITKLISAEFAIRPFIMRYPNETMKQMLLWTKHQDHSVRRLASEGCRPRLPWAQALPDFKKDPTPVLTVIENLKCDTSEYVRRSVANNLNDIAKDHPNIALQIARKWQGKNSLTDWIIKHGCRTLLKKGNEAVLNLHGFNPKAKASVKNLEISKKVDIGDTLHFRFNFFNREKQTMKFRLEYAIDYITGSGKISRKIFKLSENTFEPFDAILFQRRQSFKDFTTRKHYKGKHYLRILANGKELAAGEFSVC